MECGDDGSTFQNDLDVSSTWERRWDMAFDISKCQVVHVPDNERPIKTSYILHGPVMESVTCAIHPGFSLLEFIHTSTG